MHHSALRFCQGQPWRLSLCIDSTRRPDGAARPVSNGYPTVEGGEIFRHRRGTHVAGRYKVEVYLAPLSQEADTIEQVRSGALIGIQPCPRWRRSTASCR